MKITNIVQTGAADLLMYAIAHNADIKSDQALQSMISAETCYLMTISDVNFLELFRLAQRYREKLKIMDEKPAAVPDKAVLDQKFNGTYTDPDDENKKVPLSDFVTYASTQFVNLALQMSADDDIIRPDAARMFFPMISRSFDVQIPVSFMDIMAGIGSSDECDKLFNADYPGNLNTIIVEAESSGIRNHLMLSLMMATSIIRYEKQYENLIKMTKYFPLKTVKTNKLYKFAICGFHKYDNISRGEIRCTMFHPDKKIMASNMKKMANLSTPLKVDFCVQMPIQYMVSVLNAFGPDQLDVNFDASMSSIIDGGLVFDDFIMKSYDEESDEAIEYENAVSAYKTRINEANQVALNTLPILLKSDGDIDITGAFSILPSIYTTKAVFTIDTEKMDGLKSHIDDNIASMFSDMCDTANGLRVGLGSAKN